MIITGVAIVAVEEAALHTVWRDSVRSLSVGIPWHDEGFGCGLTALRAVSTVASYALSVYLVRRWSLQWNAGFTRRGVAG